MKSSSGGETMKIRTRLIFVCLLVALMLLLQPANTLRPAAKATVVTTNDELPFSDVVPGCEEPVFLKGRLHLVTHVTDDGSGGFHMESHMNAQRIFGFGVTTGTIYSAPLAESFDFETSGPPPQVITQEAHYALISHGGASNLEAHTLLHFTINANGVVTASVSDTRIECTGQSNDDVADDGEQP
jgi:hypothetical protein